LPVHLRPDAVSRVFEELGEPRELVTNVATRRRHLHADEWGGRRHRGRSVRLALLGGGTWW
jgi:hypothetical protein